MLRSASRGILRGEGPALALRSLASAADAPKMITATLEAVSEQATTLCKKDNYRFVVDEPKRLGGNDIGPNPLATFLGGLLGCTAYTMTSIAKEMGITIARASWAAQGEFDFRGLKGHPEVDAAFQKISVVGTLDSSGSQAQLDALAEAVERRCIVAATLRRVQGLEMSLQLKKGALEPDADLQAALKEGFAM